MPTETKNISDNRIAIARGHGEGNRIPFVFDPGAIFKGETRLREADITFYVANQIRIKLQFESFKVLPIRLNKLEKIGRTLNSGIKQANALNCKAYVSIHCNSSAEKEISGGFEIWANDLNKGFKIANQIEKVVGPFIEDKIINRGIRFSEHLAEPALFRGESCIIELGFLNSSNDRKYLSDLNFLDQMARKIVEGIKNYLRTT